MSTSIDFKPKDLLTGKKDDTYILNHQDIMKLLKYVWGGVLIPTDKKTYVDRMDLTEESVKTLSPLIEKLIPTFTTIHGHCKKFKDDTYPSIVSLASFVKDYAFKAGGNGVVKNSYYTYLQKLIDAAANEPDAKKAAAGKKDVNDLIDVMVKDIKALVDKATQNNKDLQTFEEQCKTDQANLKSNADDVKTKLTSKKGDLTTLEDKIKTDRDDLKTAQDEYEHDCIVAETTPTYAWCTILGLIAAISVASVYGLKATAAKKKIDELKSAIDSEDKQIKAANRLIGDLSSFKSNLDSLQTAAADAIKTIEKMIGIWNGISDDLKSLRKMTDTDIRQAQGIVLKIEIKTICGQWKTLQDSAERYRLVAFISAPEVITLEEASNLLSKYIPPKH